MSILYIAARLITKRWLPQVPGPIVVVALTILATRLWELHNYGIALIDQSVGPPAVRTPHFGVRRDLIAFVESIAATRAFQRSEDRVLTASRHASRRRCVADRCQ